MARPYYKLVNGKRIQMSDAEADALEASWAAQAAKEAARDREQEVIDSAGPLLSALIDELAVATRSTRPEVESRIKARMRGV